MSYSRTEAFESQMIDSVDTIEPDDEEKNIENSSDKSPGTPTCTSDENDDSDENKNDDCDDDEKSREDELSLLLEPLTFTENSDLYVVCVDGIPKFYVQNVETAVTKMWDVARMLSLDQNSSGYRTNFVKIGENELHLLGCYRFFIVSYDTFLHRISYSKIRECV